MRSLVIYFSRNGENYFQGSLKNIEKGNTEVLAELIQKELNAEIFKIEPKKEYPHGYYDCCDVAKEELNKQIFPELKKYLDNIEEFDHIYIGYPI